MGEHPRDSQVKDQRVCDSHVHGPLTLHGIT